MARRGKHRASPESADPSAVPPPSSFFVADELREQIEQLAPHRYSVDRERVFTDLRHVLGSDNVTSGLSDSYVAVLVAVRTVQGQFPGRPVVAPATRRVRERSPHRRGRKRRTLAVPDPSTYAAK